VARPVNPEVLEFMRLTDNNVTEYRQYASNRLVFQITFTLMYLGLALVLLLAALWIGIALANRFVDPIRNLMIASSRVSDGDLDVQVPVQPGKGDLRDLSDLAIVQATNELDKRRRGTNLEADGHADFAIGSAGNLECVAGLWDIDSNGLFTVGMFAGGGDGIEVLDVEEGRRGDLDSIDVGAGGNCL